MVQTLPVGVVTFGKGGSVFGVRVEPGFDPVDDSLINDRLKFASKEQVALGHVADATKVVDLEVVRTAAAPVDYSLVLALATQLALPIGDV